MVSPGQGSIEVGKELQPTVMVKDREGNILHSRRVTWESENTGIAQVGATSGKVTGKNQGTTRIIATLEGVRDVMVITVTPVPVAEIQLSPVVLTMEEGEQARVTARLLDQDGNELIGRTLTWQSSNDEIATVFSVSPSEGLIAGIDASVEDGAVTVTATAEGTKSPMIVQVEHGPKSSVQVAW